MPQRACGFLRKRICSITEACDFPWPPPGFRSRAGMRNENPHFREPAMRQGSDERIARRNPRTVLLASCPSGLGDSSTSTRSAVFRGSVAMRGVLWMRTGESSSRLKRMVATYCARGSRAVRGIDETGRVSALVAPGWRPPQRRRWPRRQASVSWHPGYRHQPRSQPFTFALRCTVLRDVRRKFFPHTGRRKGGYFIG